MGIGESNPGGHERKAGAPVKLRTASGPQATERGAKEEACEQGEAGGQSPMGHDAAAKRRCKEIGKTLIFTTWYPLRPLKQIYTNVNVVGFL